jgi:transcriptional regulator PpsR
MDEDTFARPDITLTLDANGVIRTAVSSDVLAEEGIDAWRGQAWGETIDPAVSPQILRMIEDMRHGGASSCFQVRQRLPSGRELPLEYTTVSLGPEAGFIAVGKNIQAISDLQSRLHLAQQERERDYWKYREIETRYKMLFDASTEAAIVVRVSNLRIVEANVAATKDLGLLPGPEFQPDMPPRDRKSFEAMLLKVREHGRAPGIAVRLSGSSGHWSLRASLMNTNAGAFYLFQMTPMGASTGTIEALGAPSVEDVIQRMPDGFAIVDRDGVVRQTNHTFLDMAQIGAVGAVVGESIRRWLSHPGADILTILGIVQRHGSVRSMLTTLYGELGSNTFVEVSAVGDKAGDPDYVGLLLRDVTMRHADGRGENGAAPSLVPETFSEDFSLENLVRTSTEAIEQKAILAMLDICRGNRTAAARRLGLSRQSLHAKLRKYDLDGI